FFCRFLCPPASPPFPYTTLFRSLGRGAGLPVAPPLAPQQRSPAACARDAERGGVGDPVRRPVELGRAPGVHLDDLLRALKVLAEDRKSTRLNSSHEWISYAVFCL